MKRIPLSYKKKLSRCMNWFGLNSAMTLGVVTFFSGGAGLMVYERHAGPGEAREKAVLQEKVTHLLMDYKVSQNMNLLLQTTGGPDTGVIVDYQRAAARDKSLRDAFEAEAKDTGIALAHARQISAHDRYDLYEQLDKIQPTPDYFRKPGLLTFSHAQSQVMDRPGFAPSLETAREIVTHADHRGALTLGCLLGPFLLGLAGMFGFHAGRKRLDQSIEGDEAEARNAETKMLAAEAERKAAEAAEAERVTNLPAAVATATERDIRVRQIKLASRSAEPGKSRYHKDPI